MEWMKENHIHPHPQIRDDVDNQKIDSDLLILNYKQFTKFINFYESKICKNKVPI